MSGEAQNNFAYSVFTGGRPVEIGKSPTLEFCPPPLTIANYILAPLKTHALTVPHYFGTWSCALKFCPPLQLFALKFYVPPPFPPRPPAINNDRSLRMPKNSAPTPQTDTPTSCKNDSPLIAHYLWKLFMTSAWIGSSFTWEQSCFTSALVLSGLIQTVSMRGIWSCLCTYKLCHTKQVIQSVYSPEPDLRKAVVRTLSKLCPHFVRAYKYRKSTGWILMIRYLNNVTKFKQGLKKV